MFNFLRQQNLSDFMKSQRGDEIFEVGLKYSSRNRLFSFESGLPIIDWVVRNLVWALGTTFGKKLLFLRWIRLSLKEAQNNID